MIPILHAFMHLPLMPHLHAHAIACTKRHNEKKMCACTSYTHTQTNSHACTIDHTYSHAFTCYILQAKYAHIHVIHITHMCTHFKAFIQINAHALFTKLTCMHLGWKNAFSCLCMHTHKHALTQDLKNTIIHLILTYMCTQLMVKTLSHTCASAQICDCSYGELCLFIYYYVMCVECLIKNDPHNVMLLPLVP